MAAEYKNDCTPPDPRSRPFAGGAGGKSVAWREIHAPRRFVMAHCASVDSAFLRLSSALGGAAGGPTNHGSPPQRPRAFFTARPL